MYTLLNHIWVRRSLPYAEQLPHVAQLGQLVLLAAAEQGPSSFWHLGRGRHHQAVADISL